MKVLLNCGIDIMRLAIEANELNENGRPTLGGFCGKGWRKENIIRLAKQQLAS